MQTLCPLGCWERWPPVGVLSFHYDCEDDLESGEEGVRVGARQEQENSFKRNTSVWCKFGGGDCARLVGWGQRRWQQERIMRKRTIQNTEKLSWLQIFCRVIPTFKVIFLIYAASSPPVVTHRLSAGCKTAAALLLFLKKSWKRQQIHFFEKISSL